MRRLKRRINGLAITTILLAVVLLAAIAVTIAMSSRSGNASSSQQQDKLLATTLMNQAQQIKTSVELALSNGVDISTIGYSVAAPGNITNFSPLSAGIASQVTPLQATPDPSSFYWLWHGGANLVKIMNVGSSAGNYLVEIDPLTQGVCQQINQGLFGDPSIQNVTSSGWGGPHPVDATADTFLDGKQEACFYSTADSRYMYYKVMLVQ